MWHGAQLLWKNTLPTLVTLIQSFDWSIDTLAHLMTGIGVFGYVFYCWWRVSGSLSYTRHYKESEIQHPRRFAKARAVLKIALLVWLVGYTYRFSWPWLEIWQLPLTAPFRYGGFVLCLLGYYQLFLGAYYYTSAVRGSWWQILYLPFHLIHGGFVLLAIGLPLITANDVVSMFLIPLAVMSLARVEIGELWRPGYFFAHPTFASLGHNPVIIWVQVLIIEVQELVAFYFKRRQPKR